MITTERRFPKRLEGILSIFFQWELRMKRNLMSNNSQTNTVFRVTVFTRAIWYQPRFQGLSLSCLPEREKRDPGTGWSRVYQNLGDDNKIVRGRGRLECILPILSLRESGKCCMIRGCFFIVTSHATTFLTASLFSTHSRLQAVQTGRDGTPLQRLKLSAQKKLLAVGTD